VLIGNTKGRQQPWAFDSISQVGKLSLVLGLFEPIVRVIGVDFLYCVQILIFISLKTFEILNEFFFFC